MRGGVHEFVHKLHDPLWQRGSKEPARENHGKVFRGRQAFAFVHKLQVPLQKEVTGGETVGEVPGTDWQWQDLRDLKVHGLSPSLRYAFQHGY